VPAESWNFDIDNARNQKGSGSVYGYVVDFESAKQDRATIVFTSEHPRTHQRYIVGLYIDAERLKREDHPWRIGKRGKGDGSDGFVNIRASRTLVVQFGESLAIPWKLTRYYDKKYKTERQWPGQKSFLILPTKGIKAVFHDIVAFHTGMLRDPTVDQRVVRRVLQLCKRILGDSKSALPTKISPPPIPPTPPDLRPGEVIEAARVNSTFETFLRQNHKLRILKDAYGCRCQVNTKHEVKTSFGSYVEIHHLKALKDGGLFSDETYSNCLVVCPSCHVLLQQGAIWIEPKDGKTIRHYLGSKSFEGRKIKLIERHKLSKNILQDLARAAKPE